MSSVNFNPMKDQVVGESVEENSSIMKRMNEITLVANRLLDESKKHLIYGCSNFVTSRDYFLNKLRIDVEIPLQSAKKSLVSTEEREYYANLSRVLVFLRNFLNSYAPILQ